MINKILLVIVIILSSILVIVSSSVKTTFFNTKADIKINVLDATNNNVDNLELEDYVIGVVAAEMPASFNEEALKAQAVASRSYALYKIQINEGNYDVVTDVSNQRYITEDEMKMKWQTEFDKYYNKIKKAVSDTKGQVLVSNGNVIEAFYFAMSNGYTEDSALVFKEDRDYLKSVKSEYDNDSLKNFIYNYEFSINDFVTKLNLTSNLINIKDIDRSETNRVKTININDQIFTGVEIRNKLGLRSTDFDINLLKDKVLIITRGYGHGVGMSQYGANGMANAGNNYEEILYHYYKNVKITTI